MPVRIENETDVMARASRLKSRFARQHRLMDDLDPWYHGCVEDLTEEIWQDVPENAKRWTVAVPYITATTNTIVAFLSGKRPQITTAPKDPLSLSSMNRANANERLGAALFDTIDRDRPTSLLAQSAFYAVHRGNLVGKILHLSPEERGEEREEVVPQIDAIPGLDELVPEEYVVGERKFPLLVQLLDPRDCMWTLGRDDRVIEFVHEYHAPFSLLCDQWPNLADMDEFRSFRDPSTYDAPVCVIDYWNEAINAILVNGTFYKKPTEHGYPEIPFVVEMVSPRKYRNRGDNTVEFEGTPFCSNMLNAVRQMSRADSISASYLEEGAMATVIHQGIDPGTSPYWQKITEGEDAGQMEYIAILDHSTGARLMPAFNNEQFRYMDPPPIVPVLQEFKQARMRDLALNSFPESILSGAQTADVSGYAYSQMKQAAIARIEPPRISGDRFWGRMLMLGNRLIAHFWDFLEGDPMFLVALGADGTERPMPVTKEEFESVGHIRVVIKPEIPINEEQERGLIYQEVTLGLRSRLDAMDKINIPDPTAEAERISFEQMEQIDPTIKAAVADRYMERNGLKRMQPAMPDPVAAAAPPAGPMAAGAPPAGAPPVDPLAALMGGAPAPAPAPAPEGGPLPPELMALLGG